MKTWSEVRELVDVAEKNHWDLATFQALLSWEFRDKAMAPGGKVRRVMVPKRTMSAAGRARISAAQKARWAKVRKSQK